MGVASSTSYLTNATCDSCLTWSTKTRAFVSGANNNCSNVISGTGIITDCNVYGNQYTGTVSTSVPGLDSCHKCSKTYYNVKKLTSAGNMSGSCSDSKGDGCSSKISNCYQTKCYSNYSGSTVYTSQLCSMCKSNYVPAGLDIWAQGATSCVKGNTILNCKYEVADTSIGGSPVCAGCDKNYAIGSGSCIGFSSDENCMNASTGGTGQGCMKCWSAYYFNGKTCKLGSNIFKLGLLGLMALVSLYY